MAEDILNYFNTILVDQITTIISSYTSRPKLRTDMCSRTPNTSKASQQTGLLPISQEHHPLRLMSGYSQGLAEATELVTCLSASRRCIADRRVVMSESCVTDSAGSKADVQNAIRTPRKVPALQPPASHPRGLDPSPRNPVSPCLIGISSFLCTFLTSHKPRGDRDCGVQSNPPSLGDNRCPPIFVPRALTPKRSANDR